jgi:hypothetical protein
MEEFPLGTIVRFDDYSLLLGASHHSKITGLIEGYESWALVRVDLKGTQPREFLLPVEDLTQTTVNALNQKNRNRLPYHLKEIQNASQENNQSIPLGTIVQFTGKYKSKHTGLITKYKPVAVIRSGTLGLRKFETPKVWKIDMEKLEKVNADELPRIKGADPALIAGLTETKSLVKPHNGSTAAVRRNTSWIKKHNNTPTTPTAAVESTTPKPTETDSEAETNNNNNNNTNASIKAAINSFPSAPEPWEKLWSTTHKRVYYHHPDGRSVWKLSATKGGGSRKLKRRKRTAKYRN